jgi:hypothetical protein
MYTVHAQLFNGDGKEIEAKDTIRAHSLSLAFTAATSWGRGVLGRTYDPNAYVVYTATQTKKLTA